MVTLFGVVTPTIQMLPAFVGAIWPGPIVQLLIDPSWPQKITGLSCTQVQPGVELVVDCCAAPDGALASNIAPNKISGVISLRLRINGMASPEKGHYKRRWFSSSGQLSKGRDFSRRNTARSPRVSAVLSGRTFEA